MGFLERRRKSVKLKLQDCNEELLTADYADDPDKTWEKQIRQEIAST
jgi:hypothetical protein